MGSFLKGLARAFTVPRALRNRLKSNPITVAAQTALMVELGSLIPATVSQHVSDPAAASAISEAIAHGVKATGIFD